MRFLEKNLEQIIFDADKSELNKRGLYVFGKLIRQLKIGNYGIADLIEFQKPYYNPYDNKLYKGEITVYELKQEKIGVYAFLQALGYLKGIRTYLSLRGMEDNYNYKIVLIGSELELNSTFCYLPDFFTFYNNESELYDVPQFCIELYTYSYELDGMKFININDYNLKNKGF